MRHNAIPQPRSLRLQEDKLPSNAIKVRFGDLFRDQQLCGEAIDYYSSAVKSGETNRSVLNALERLYRDEGELIRLLELKERRKSPDQEVTIDPDSIKLSEYASMASSLMKREAHPNKALAFAEKPIELDPDNKYYKLTRARAYIQNANYEVAFAELTRFIKQFAENMLLKRQLLVLKRCRKRAPKLPPLQRLFFPFWRQFLKPRRIERSAITFRPSTLFRIQAALVPRKYRLLFSSKPPRQPGPKSPSPAVIQAILEVKCRNPEYGCPRIAQQLADTLGIDLDNYLWKSHCIGLFEMPMAA